MPFTPFHIGPALLVGLMLFPYLDLPTFLLANVILDVEPFLVLILGLGLPLHGFFHSLIGGTIAALALSLIIARAGVYLGPVTSFFRMGQKIEARRVVAAALGGVYLHVLLDAPLYWDIKPFYPYGANPLLGSLSSFQVYALCWTSFPIGIALYLVRLLLRKGASPK